MLTAPEIVIAYARHRCNARVAMQAMDAATTAACWRAAIEAVRNSAGTEWRSMDRVAEALDADPTLIDPATALARAGLRLPEGV